MSWQVIRALATGVRHLSKGEEIQDVAEVCHEQDWCFGALADGAGSACYGVQGAGVAVQQFLSHAYYFLETQQLEKLQNEAFLHDFGQQILERIRVQIQTVAQQQNTAIKSFAATLVGFIAGPQFMAVIQLGDGFLVWEREEHYHLACPPPQSEYINETVFITCATAAQELQTKVISGPVQFVAASSDGLSPVSLAWPSHRPSQQFFKPLKNWIEKEPESVEIRLKRFLNSEKLNQKTTDDKSLILIHRRTA